MIIKWQESPPPAIGWWPASYAKDAEVIRWWDGQCWSIAALPACTRAQASALAGVKTMIPESKIEWAQGWWA